MVLENYVVWKVSSRGKCQITSSFVSSFTFKYYVWRLFFFVIFLFLMCCPFLSFQWWVWSSCFVHMIRKVVSTRKVNWHEHLSVCVWNLTLWFVIFKNKTKVNLSFSSSRCIFSSYPSKQITVLWIWGSDLLLWGSCLLWICA